MIINGYGEFESIRKAAQKDLASASGKKAEATSAATTRTTDQADLSGSARMYQMKDTALQKLEQIPDPREDKIQEALERLERGTLMTPQAVRESIGRMVDRGILP